MTSKQAISSSKAASQASSHSAAAASSAAIVSKLYAPKPDKQERKLNAEYQKAFSQIKLSNLTGKGAAGWTKQQTVTKLNAVLGQPEKSYAKTMVTWSGPLSKSNYIRLTVTFSNGHSSAKSLMMTNGADQITSKQAHSLKKNTSLSTVKNRLGKPDNQEAMGSGKISRQVLWYYDKNFRRNYTLEFNNNKFASVYATSVVTNNNANKDSK